jgi:regulator of replication initiation timing
MKNKYEISQNYILNLENEALREKVMKLIADYKELKNEYDKREAERLGQQNQRDNAIIKERQIN